MVLPKVSLVFVGFIVALYVFFPGCELLVIFDFLAFQNGRYPNRERTEGGWQRKDLT